MTLSIQTDYFSALKQAAQYVNNGQLQEAKLLTLQLTSFSTPPTNEHFRLLAHIARKEENFSLALSFIEKGLKISQDNHHLFYELKGLILQKLESHEEARVAFRESLSLNYKQLTSIKNYFSSSLNINNPDLCKEALDTCDFLLSQIDSNEDSDLFAEIQNSKGIALLYLKDYKNGLNAFLLALKIGSINSEFFFNVGYAYFHLKDYKKCIEYLNQGLLFEPNNLRANKELIECYLKLKQIDNAYSSITQFITFYPKEISLKILLGEIYKEKTLYSEAEKIFEEVLENDPYLWKPYYYLGDVYEKQNQLEKSLDILNKGFILFPENPFINSLIATKLRLLGQFNDWEKHSEKALKADPNSSAFLFNHSLLELTKGNFKEGWKLYTHRIDTEKCKFISRNIQLYKKPIWQGESLTDKSIFVHYEQGAGDFLQFCRYLPWLKTYTERVYLSTSEALSELISYNYNLLKLTPIPPNFMEEISYQIPIGQLPLIHQTNFDNMLNNIPYLKANAAKKEPFKNLFSISKLKVGIFWQGSPSHFEDRYRSNKLKDWLPLIQQFKNNIQFYSLQKGFGEEQLNEIDNDGSLIPLGPYFHNYADTAAAVDMLDLVISVDSSVVHLSGALGKPTWILLPLAPDWRWLLDREDSPWYPTARLFRKQKNQTWSDLLSKVAHQLQLSFF